MNATSKREPGQSLPRKLACLAVTSCFMHSAVALMAPVNTIAPVNQGINDSQARAGAAAPVQATLQSAPAGSEPNIFLFLVRRTSVTNAEAAVRGKDGKIFLVTRKNAGQVLARENALATPIHAKSGLDSGGFALMQ